MAEWKPINLMDVIGMASNPVNPGEKYAKRLLNVYTHEKPGALTLRPGYAPKHTPPSNSTITNSSFINFGVFFDRQADPDGQEIICEIQKGTVTALSGSGVADTMNGFWFWTRPYWTGAVWVDSWDWINKTIITKITAIDATYLSHIEVFGNATHALGNDSLIGWTIYNKTKEQFAKVITCKLDSPDLSLNITLYNNGWEVDDIVIISKSWIDIDAQTEYYNNVTKEDIVFHRINHDLRIGFGGFINRPGLAIGYRKKYLQILEVDFDEIHADISEAGALEKFAKTDGIVLDTAILTSQYGIKLTATTGTLPAGVNYFRLSGLIDNYEEQYIAQGNIEVSGLQDLLLQSYLITGVDNARVTKLILYHSTDNITFYKVREDIIASDNLSQPTFTLGEDGNLESISESFQGAGEYHKDSNAASITNETDSIGQWVNLGYENLAQGIALDSVITFTHPVIGAIAPEDGTYFLYWQNTSVVSQPMKIKSPPITTSKKTLTITFQIVARYITVRVSSVPPDDPNGFPNPFGEDEDYIDIVLTDLMDWQEHAIELAVNGSLTFEVIQGNVAGQRIGVDGLTIINPSAGTPEQGAEMALEMGYFPTLNLVKGWDQALDGGNGRIYYLNPYIEKRYENYLVVSHIHSNGSFMRDLASFSNFRELEKYDSNETIAIELLPNKQILILKDSSVTSLADDGLVGFMREPIYGFDCVSRNSVVNISGLVFFCGKEEIYLINIGSSLIPKPLLKNTIRDLYLAIEDKTKILGTRNRFNTYRIRINDSAQKTEYLLSDDGWVEERKWHFPEIYRLGFNNKLYFLSNGTIYEETVDFTLPEQEYGEIGVE